MQAAAFADGGVLATFSPAGALIALRILHGLFSVFPFKIKKALLHLVRLNRDDRIRTCDILVPNQARYQLRYIP